MSRAHYYGDDRDDTPLHAFDPDADIYDCDPRDFWPSSLDPMEHEDEPEDVWELVCECGATKDRANLYCDDCAARLRAEDHQ